MFRRMKSRLKSNGSGSSLSPQNRMAHVKCQGVTSRSCEKARQKLGNGSTRGRPSTFIATCREPQAPLVDSSVGQVVVEGLDGLAVLRQGETVHLVLLLRAHTVDRSEVDGLHHKLLLFLNRREQVSS